ncbi:FAD-dependent oxidoreductase, partial [Microbacterium gubbeenense]
GGGLLGLEAAGALQGLEVATEVVHSGSHLMSAQLDRGAGEVLGRLIDARGIGVRTSSRTSRIDPGPTGEVVGAEMSDGSWDAVDVVVFTVGVRADDILARDAQLECAPTGGVAIDDGCRTSDRHILAIGEVA